jgi:hypothetical protein
VESGLYIAIGNAIAIAIGLVYIHELVVRARQLGSAAQLVRALCRNRKAASKKKILERK